MMKKYVWVLLLSPLVFASRLKDQTTEPPPPGVCDTDTVSFSGEIQPLIIDASCNVAGCHDSGTSSAGYAFGNYDQISSNSAVILEVLSHNSGVSPMPLGGDKLADSLIQKFDCWIQQGLLDN